MIESRKISIEVPKSVSEKGEKEFKVKDSRGCTFTIQSPFVVYDHSVRCSVIVYHVDINTEGSDVAYIIYDYEHQHRKKCFHNASTFLNIWRYRMPD